MGLIKTPGGEEVVEVKKVISMIPVGSLGRADRSGGDDDSARSTRGD